MLECLVQSIIPEIISEVCLFNSGNCFFIFLLVPEEECDAKSEI